MVRQVLSLKLQCMMRSVCTLQKNRVEFHVGPLSDDTEYQLVFNHSIAGEGIVKIRFRIYFKDTHCSWIHPSTASRSPAVQPGPIDNSSLIAAVTLGAHFLRWMTLSLQDLIVHRYATAHQIPRHHFRQSAYTPSPRDTSCVILFILAFTVWQYMPGNYREIDHRESFLLQS